MFEKSLEDKLKRIFQFNKVSYDTPSDIKEQECLFVRIDKAIPSIKDKMELCKVMGKLQVFANSDKLPYGYFLKCISKAQPDDVRDFFFYDMEENVGYYRNLDERSVSFVYFFNSQFDPDVGSITSITFSEVTES